MKYQAIIFDIDGTAVPNSEDGVPSPKLIQAVRNAQKIIPVSVATGRPWYLAKPIVEKLGITSLCVLSGGSQIIDPKAQKIVWEKLLSLEQVEKIIDICRPLNLEIYFSDETDPRDLKKEVVVDQKEKIIWIVNLTKEQTGDLEIRLSVVLNIQTHIVPDWIEGRFALTINHSEATKKDALKVLFEMLKVDPATVMAVGDSGNDLPLFEMAGYKVAMGNATADLKEKADYITDSVDEDGLAKVIEQNIYKIKT